MPVIEIQKDDLLRLVGKDMNNDEIEEVMFLLKSEVTFSGNTMECEINPDRPDMFSVEGIARAIRSFTGVETGLRKYRMEKPAIKMTVEPVEARPSIACAVIKDVKLDDSLVKSLMQLQEKLHDGLGRKRAKVAVGVHDFDRMRTPIIYKQSDPKDTFFIPLNESREMSLEKTVEKTEKGREYANLLRSYEFWPVIMDDMGIMSFPPILNSDRTKVTENTRSLFIDVTGTDKKAVEFVLNIIICNITERGGRIFPVKSGENEYPNLEPREMKLEVKDIDSLLGLGLSENDIKQCLERMGYEVVKMRGGFIDILIPAYRADIMHAVDIIEDVAMGYGFNNIEPALPKIPTLGGYSERERMIEKMRLAMIGLGFQEFMGFILTNSSNNFRKMHIEEGEHAEILNPVSSDYAICRTWLLPSLMKVLSGNKHYDYPQTIFEVGDAILVDESAETGAKNIKKLAVVVAHDRANLTEMKSYLESFLGMFDVDYQIEPAVHSSFITGRVGKIIIDGKHAGFFGEIRPEVLDSWKMDKPVIAFELDLERLM